MFDSQTFERKLSAMALAIDIRELLLMAQATRTIPNTVPGSVGFFGLGDKTYEFAVSPLDFIKKYVREHNSSVFKVRMLNKPTIFITSNNAVRDLLKDEDGSFFMGYKDFGYMHSLYGDLLLFFDDGDMVARLRGLVHSMFVPKTVENFIEIVQSTCDRNLPGFVQQDPIVIYDQFKKLATEICLTMFLGMDCHSAEEEAQRIVGLTVTHWHGLISVPINIKVGNYTSSYSLAIDAQNRLLEVIKRRLPESENCLLSVMNHVGFQSDDELSRHMLLFISALVPKALSSLLTSCCLELAKPHNASRRHRAATDDEFLDKILLEVKRLWPPFLGGRRVAKQNVVLQGFHIPKGFSVAYLTRNANLDSTVFENPETFLPERWEAASNAPDRSRVFTFGYGPRNCIGEHCIGRIIHVIMKRLLTQYHWTLEADQDLTYKWLPVSRPKHNVLARFTNIQSTAECS